MLSKRSLILRRIRCSLLPSISSGIVGILTVAIGLLDMGMRQGIVPVNLQVRADRLAPIASFSSSIWSGALVLGAWLLVLILVLDVFDFLFGVYAGKNQQKQIDVSEKQWLLERTLWRLVIGAVVVIGVLIVMPFVHWVSSAEKTTVAELSLTDAAWRMLLAALIWAFIYHIATAFLRLLIFRPTVFSSEKA